MGLYVGVERHTANGRMDIVMQTSDYVYIFELKIDQTADAALRQIEEKHQIEEKQYASGFSADGRHIYKIGVNFSTEKRTISYAIL